ncbi:MAG TPA: hypothetical protein VKT78_10640 [Fimbriimonadaceae bacterium]|nr:hypothetical protein [Fimbriimonadaceae bacterium]
MRAGNSVGLLLTALGLVAAAATGARARDDESALRLLVKAFDRSSPKNIDAIMRMSLDSPGERQTVQVRIAKDGRQRVEVIEPLSRKGLIILELELYREIYNPDKGTLSIGRSMQADLFDPSERLRLVRKNYSLKMIHGVELAHRRVVRIDATSRYADVGGARIFIDPDSYFVMRVDTVSNTGDVTRKFETTTVSYPADLPPGIFDLSGERVTVIHETDPEPVSNASEAARKAGFRPLMSHELPYGFISRKMYVHNNTSYKTIGFNLSDGLAAATIFEFDLRHCPADVVKQIHAEMRSRPNDFMTEQGITIGIVSDVCPKARKKLLEAFRPRHRSALNDAEKFFIDGTDPALSVGPGTVPSTRCVTTYRRVWRNRPQFG